MKNLVLSAILLVGLAGPKEAKQKVLFGGEMKGRKTLLVFLFFFVFVSCKAISAEVSTFGQASHQWKDFRNHPQEMNGKAVVWKVKVWLSDIEYPLTSSDLGSFYAVMKNPDWTTSESYEIKVVFDYSTLLVEDGDASTIEFTKNHIRENDVMVIYGSFTGVVTDDGYPIIEATKLVDKGYQ